MSIDVVNSIGKICQKWIDSEENDKLNLLLEKAKIIDSIGLENELQIVLLKNKLKELDNLIQEKFQPNWQATNEQLIQISEITKRIKELGGNVDQSPTFKLYCIRSYVK